MTAEVLDQDTELPSWRRANPEWEGGAPETPAKRPDRRSVPRSPTKVQDLGVPTGLIEDIFMRRLLTLKRGTTSQLGEDLALSMNVIQQIGDGLRDKKLLEYLGMYGRNYEFSLTAAGEEQTVSRLAISQYSGFAPVSLADYDSIVRRQDVIPKVGKQTVRDAMSDLVFPAKLIDRVGAALLNDGAVFIYGPPGTGKTSLAERMGSVINDPVLVPHCIEVDGNIISVFDPSVHIPVEQPENLDARWVACRRPFVLVGGELTLSMLDLGKDESTGVYFAPKQLIANNGILVIDDFGRQRATPEEILNRWIVPLSRKVDYLQIASGTSFSMPFAVKLVVSSNLDPNALGDEAFLRRLRTKVSVATCNADDFDEILTRAAESFGVELGEGASEYLREVCVKHLGQLRPYVAFDFCDLMQGICDYEKVPLLMDRTMIDHIVEVYFVESPAD